MLTFYRLESDFIIFNISFSPCAYTVYEVWDVHNKN